MIVWTVTGIGKWNKPKHYGPFKSIREAEKYAGLAMLKAVCIIPKEVSK